MSQPTKRSLQSPRNMLLVLVLAVSMLAVCPRPSWAGPGGRLLKELVAGAAGAALLELGKKAYANYQDNKLDREPDALRDCMRTIFGNPKAQTQTPYAQAESFLQTKRRLDSDRASDIAMSSLIDICEAHAVRPYTDLVGAYYTAVTNRANNLFTRFQKRYLSCTSVESWADRCVSSRLAQDQVRLPGEIAAARRAFCGLDGTERGALMLRGMFGIPFAEVGRELGLSAQQAHDLYHNALRRVQSQLRAGCFME